MAYTPAFVVRGKKIYPFGVVACLHRLWQNMPSTPEGYFCFDLETTLKTLDRNLLPTMILAALLCAPLLGGDAAWAARQAPAEERRTIVVVGDKTYAPIEFLGPDGRPRGVAVDMWRLWSQKTGVAIDYRLVDWAQAIEMVRQRRADVVSGLFPREGAGLWFCQPFMNVDAHLFFSRKIKGLVDSHDLAGFRVGVVRGDYLEGLLRVEAPGAKLVLAETFEEMIKMAIAGRVEVFACDEPVAAFLLAKHDAEDMFRRTDKPLHQGQLRPGVAAGGDEMMRLVNAGFDAIDEAERQAVIDRWSGHPLWGGGQWLWLCGAFALALAAALIFLAWNRQLKIRVDRATRQIMDKRQEMEAVFNALPDLLFRLDATGRYIDYHGGRETKPFMPPEQFMGRVIAEVMPPDAARSLTTAMQLARERRQAVGLEYELTIDGARRHYEARLAPLSFDEIICVVRDVSQRKLAEQEQKMAATVFENSIEGIVVADAEGKVRLVNSAFTAITGYGSDDVVGKEMDVLRAETMDLALYEEIWGHLAEHGQWSGEYWNRRKSGEAYPEWLTVTVIRDSSGRVINYLAIFYDITEIKRSQEQIRYQAYHDALTGLPNRNLFKDRLGQALHHAERRGSKVAVLFVDLDNFKLINDSLGHDVGDRVLRDIAGRLRRCVRDEDTVARIGGDEFIMVLEEIDGELGADRVARRVLDNFSRPFSVGGHEFQLGASIGVTVFPDDGQDVETLIKNADMAMYRAKERGKNNYQMFTPAMQAKTNLRMEMERALRQALEREEFVVHYQAKVETASGRIVGMEALARWQSPGQGLVMPGQFIPVAEESGLITAIGKVILRQACRQASRWQTMTGRDLRLAVNVSAKQLYQPEFVETVEAILRETGLAPGLLELEVTESVVMHQDTAANRALLELAALGVSLAIDDFGTGYSSLYYLKHFPIDTLKIDRGFVRELIHDANDAAIVGAIVSLGHSLGLTVVAEGVENAQQLAHLRALGCDLCQGYYFSKPAPAEQFTDLLLWS